MGIQCNGNSLRRLALAVLCVLSGLGIVYAAEPEKVSPAQSYVLKNGVEESRRSYLLVYAPDKPGRRNTSVVSECRKPYQEEGVYGKCKHRIGVSPIAKTFTVVSGEDVVMIQTAWDTPLVLGTIDYGCCAAPLTITFYKEDGERLGLLKKVPGALHSLYGNAITRLWDLDNSTGRHDKVQFFVVQDDRKDDVFYALKRDMNGNFVKLPIHYENPNAAKCRDWYLGGFIKYGDRNDITLTLEGFFCANNTTDGYEKKIYGCRDSDKAIECTIRR